MMLTDLADVLRAAGLTVIEEPGWKTRGRGQMTAVRGIILHHTAGGARDNYPSRNVVLNGRADLPGPLAQLGLARDGSVIVFAAGVANHAGAPDKPHPSITGNSTALGIEAESTGVKRADGSYDWTAAQLFAYPRMVRALARHYGVPAANVLAHREWAPSRKIDPTGIDMAAIRSFVAAPTIPGDDLTAQFEIDVRKDLAVKQGQLNALALLDKDLRLDLDVKGDALDRIESAQRDLRTLLEEVRNYVKPPTSGV